MKSNLKAVCLSGILGLTVFLAQPARADEENKRTEFRVSQPVEIPGQLLPAGTYVFQLLDSDVDRGIVLVYSEDANGKDSLVATLSTIREELAEAPDKPIVQLEERPAGTPAAIHAWFYPGDSTGWEFIYPKGESLQTSGQ